MENEVTWFSKSQKQVMHILEFVRKQENFTMEQKITYRKNKPLTKQSHRASILSLLLCHIREVTQRREYNVAFSYYN